MIFLFYCGEEIGNIRGFMKVWVFMECLGICEWFYEWISIDKDEVGVKSKVFFVF